MGILSKLGYLFGSCFGKGSTEDDDYDDEDIFNFSATNPNDPKKEDKAGDTEKEVDEDSDEDPNASGDTSSVVKSPAASLDAPKPSNPNEMKTTETCTTTVVSHSDAGSDDSSTSPSSKPAPKNNDDSVSPAPRVNASGSPAPGADASADPASRVDDAAVAVAPAAVGPTIQDRYDVLNDKLVVHHPRQRDDSDLEHEQDDSTLQTFDKVANYAGIIGTETKGVASVLSPFAHYFGKDLAEKYVNSKESDDNNQQNSQPGQDGDSNSSGIKSTLAKIVGSDGSGTTETSESTETPEEKKAREIDETEKTGKNVLSWVSAVGNASSAVGSGMKFCSNAHKSVVSKNRFKRRAAGTKAAGDFFNAGTSLVGLGNNMWDVYGNKDTEDTPGGGMDIASAFGSVLGSGLNMIGNASEYGGHRSVVDEAGAYSDPNTLLATERELNSSKIQLAIYKRLKEQSDRNNGAPVSFPDPITGNTATYTASELDNRLKDNQKKRNTAKAKKYAMHQAAKMHKSRTSDLFKGGIGFAGSSIGAFGSLFKGVSKLAGASDGTLAGIGSILGAVGSVFNMLAPLIEKGFDSHNNKKQQVKKREVVDDYFKDKKDSIQRQAVSEITDQNDITKLGNDGTTLKDEEIKVIALKRLGVQNVDFGNPVQSSDKDEAFKIITDKRAKNIIRSNDADRIKMLSALGLDKDAKYEDIVRALSGEF